MDSSKTPEQLAAAASPAQVNPHPQLCFRVVQSEDPKYTKGSYWTHCNFPRDVTYMYTFTLPAIAPAYIDELQRLHRECRVCFPVSPATDERRAPGA